MSGADVRRVFVYGTLRRDARGAVQNALTRGWAFEGYGRVAAVLYDFGAYPGAVADPTGAAWVRGEIYRLPDESPSLDALDRHEGCGPEHAPPHEFERELVEVDLTQGGAALAWIYWYGREPSGHRIESGDYLEP